VTRWELTHSPGTWNCPNLNCFQASKIEDGVKKRWDSVGAGEFFNYTAEWFYYQNEVAIGGNTMFYGTPFQDQYIRSIAYFYGGRDANGGNRAADNYDCDIIGANAWYVLVNCRLVIATNHD
jgi:hypothetical protein